MIVATYVVVAEVLAAVGRDHQLVQAGNVEVLTATVAAAYFHQHHERALQVLP